MQSIYTNPLSDSIFIADPFVLQTETGYFWGMIFGVPLSDDLSDFVGGEPKLCVYPTQDWENPADTLARSTEGMTVFRHDSTYYMTYSKPRGWRFGSRTQQPGSLSR